MSKSPDSKAVLDITESLHLRWDYTTPCTYIQTRPANCIIYHFFAWDSLHLLVAPVQLMKPGIDIESWFWVLILSPVQMSLCVYWYIAVLNFTTWMLLWVIAASLAFAVNHGVTNSLLKGLSQYHHDAYAINLGISFSCKRVVEYVAMHALKFVKW